jgi:hypothetical protein
MVISCKGGEKMTHEHKEHIEEYAICPICFDKGYKKAQDEILSINRQNIKDLLREHDDFSGGLLNNFVRQEGSNYIVDIIIDLIINELRKRKDSPHFTGDNPQVTDNQNRVQKPSSDGSQKTEDNSLQELNRKECNINEL